MLRQIKTLNLQKCNQRMLKCQPQGNGAGTQPLVAAVLWGPGEDLVWTLGLNSQEQPDGVRQQLALVPVLS